MRAYIKFKSIDALPKKPEIFRIGSFTAVSNDGRTFMFEFLDTLASATLEKSTGKYVFDCFLKEPDDETFIEDNEEANVIDEEITPKFIATSTFEEINYECYLDVDHEARDEFCFLEVLEFSIEDQEGEVTEEVPHSEIERYNKTT